VEVLLEVAPFLVGGLAVLGLGPGGAASGEEGLVGADEFVVEHSEVSLGDVDVGVAEQPGDDVDGSPVLTASAANIRRKSCGVYLSDCPAASRRLVPASARLSILRMAESVMTSQRQPVRRCIRCGSSGPTLRSCGS
jgi:hypothetical protein